ncbi:hypothetical protein PV328_008585 [Microctonus aethiopoides]|uniref:Uncharacterized protein n=1 Tax=Microctonus aethiopoides TaxID=144406 RepID=A0AA39KR94_9HYME|nr:hypothetical protein PV328_008585 [Microctonus aethiopoides]
MWEIVSLKHYERGDGKENKGLKGVRVVRGILRIKLQATAQEAVTVQHCSGECPEGLLYTTAVPLLHDAEAVGPGSVGRPQAANESHKHAP